MKFNIHIKTKTYHNIFPALLFPSLTITFLLTFISALLLTLIFLYDLNDTAFAYSTYILSFYSLIILCIAIYKNIQKFYHILQMHPWGNKLIHDHEFKVQLSLYTSLFLNLIYALFKGLSGYYFQSSWLISIAFYYMILSIMRFLLLRKDRKIKKQLHRKIIEELKTYRFCGYLMFLLNIAVTAIVLQMIHNAKYYEYPGTLIYAFAAYTFYSLISATINLIRYRSINRPILSAAKILSLANALISILALQTAMFVQFGDGESSILILNGITGGTVCLSIFIMAILMIVHSTKKIKKLQ